jgi:hypothetical protein
MRNILYTSLAAGALLASSGALAAPEKGQISIRGMAGVDFPIAGDFHGGANAPVADLGALNPALAGVGGTLAIENRGNRDIFNGSFSAGGELGYGLSEMSEVFGSFRYLRSKPSTVQVGNAVVPALNASLATFGDFGRIQSYSGEIGYRQYFTRGTIQPYAAARAGVTFTDSIDANFRVPDAGIALNNVPFYNNSVSATLGADIGVAIPLSKGVELNLETGIRWTSGLSGNDDALAGLGLAGINNAGARFDIPLRGGLTFRF